MPDKQRKRRPRPQYRKTRKTYPVRYAVLAGAVLLVGVAAVVAVLAFGGDDDGAAVPTSTPDPAGFGPAPILDGNIIEVSPEHGATVTQESTRTIDPNDPRGVCVRVRFEDTHGQWYRMAVNGEEVTSQGIWDFTRVDVDDTGRLCYDPAEGLPVGRIQAAVSVQDPQVFGAPPREVVGWEFDVVE
jgi:hypothetical protein